MTAWLSRSVRWEGQGDRVLGPDGEVRLGPDDPSAPQVEALLAIIDVGPSRAGVDGAPLVALADRPYRLDGRDTLQVDAVRAMAAFAAASAGLSFEVPSRRAPFLRAMASWSTGAPIDGWGELAQWLAGPSPRWWHAEQAYTIATADRWLFWVGLVRSADVESFLWYRSGLVLLDAALGLDGQLHDTTRAAWCQRLLVRPGPRDFRDWHDDLLRDLPTMVTARSSEGR